MVAPEQWHVGWTVASADSDALPTNKARTRGEKVIKEETGRECAYVRLHMEEAKQDLQSLPLCYLTLVDAWAEHQGVLPGKKGGMVDVYTRQNFRLARASFRSRRMMMEGIYGYLYREGCRRRGRS